MTASPAFHKAAPLAAFTLIELLVVIAIIAVLAGLALPALGRTMKSGQSAVSVANLRQLYTAFEAYANDNNNRYPPGDLGPNGDGTGGCRGLIWLSLLLPYIENGKTVDFAEWKRLCDADAADGRYNQAPSKIFIDPLALESEAQAKLKATTQDPIWGFGYNTNPWRGVSAGDLPAPANNSWTLRNTPWGTWNPWVVQLLGRLGVTYASTRCLVASANDWHLANSNARAYDRAGPGRAHVLFYDGHVETLNRQEFDLSLDDPKKLADLRRAGQ